VVTGCSCVIVVWGGAIVMFECLNILAISYNANDNFFFLTF